YAPCHLPRPGQSCSRVPLDSSFQQRRVTSPQAQVLARLFAAGRTGQEACFCLCLPPPLADKGKL
ncbi:hypothetical protein GGI13_008369, partial [Coemansia sp. RSA 455]